MRTRNLRRWVVVVLLFGSLSYCYETRDRDSRCAIQRDQVSTSPDGRWTAVSAARECGAVVVPTELVDIFRSDKSGGKWRPFEKDLPAGGTSITLMWRDARHLVVEYGDEGEVLDNDSHVGDLNIEYVAVPLRIQDRKLGKGEPEASARTAVSPPLHRQPAAPDRE